MPVEARDARTRVRTRGPVTGTLRFDAEKYVLGAPMLLEIEVRNPGPEPLGFDDRGARVVWIVRDETGKTLCDVGGHESRLGSEFVGKVTLAPGETFHETRFVNRSCEGFTKPGRYQVSVLRYVSDARPVGMARVCEDLVPAPSDPQASDVDCAKELPRYPAIAADLSLEILPFDPRALHERTGRLSAERKAAWDAHDLSREGALSAYPDWFCEHVRCSCPPLWERNGEWAVKTLENTPTTMGQGCR